MAYQAVDITLENKKYELGFYSLSFEEADKINLFGALSLDEQKVAAKFRSDLRVLQYVAGRYCSKQALIRLSKAKLPLNSFTIGTATWGFPYIDHEEFGRYNVSISHTDTIAVAICVPVSIPVGLDIELCTPGNDQLILSQLSDLEKKMIFLSNTEEQSNLLHMMWGVKEAAGKALKVGFRLPMQLFNISAVSYEVGINHVTFSTLNMLSGFAVTKTNNVLALALPSGTVINTNLNSLLLI